MVTFLITSLFVLAVLAVAVYLWQKPAASIKPETLPPSPGRGLFIDGTPDGIAQAAAEAESESIANAAAKRREIIERAKAGEKSALLEARNTANADLYEEALGSLAAGADSDSKLLALISYVTRHELRVNKKLAERLIDSYKRAPDRSSTSKVGVEIAGKRAEQRKSEGEGEAHYISQTGKAEAEKVRLMGEAQGVAYREQVNALGAQGVALVEVLKVIGEKGVRITPDIMASGGSGDGGAGGGIGTLLLLNLFRNQMSLPTTNGEKSVK